MRRIPDKHTDRAGYQRYWRDRRFLQELEAKRDEAFELAKDTDDARQPHYQLTAETLALAVRTFEEGWVK